MKWGLTLGALALVLGLCVFCALPEVLADRQHEKKAECEAVLTAVFARFAAADGGVVSSADLVAAVPAARRHPYTYFVGPEVVRPVKDAPTPTEAARQRTLVESLVQPGLTGGVLTAACIANTDDDEAVDLLSVSSVPRYVFGALPVRAGEVYEQGSDFPDDQPRAVTFTAVDAGTK